MKYKTSHRVISFIMSFLMVLSTILPNLGVIVYAENNTSYTINYYNYTGDTILYSESIAEGGTAVGYAGEDLATIAPATITNGPVTTSYTFSHWALVGDDTRAAFDLTQAITSNIDLIAVYNESTTGTDYSKLTPDENGKYWVYFNFKSDEFTYKNETETHSANLNFYFDVTNYYNQYGHACIHIIDTYGWDTIDLRGSIPYGNYFATYSDYIVEGTYDGNTYSNIGTYNRGFDIEYLLGISDTYSKYVSSNYQNCVSYLPYESQVNTDEYAYFNYIQGKPIPKVTYYNYDGSTILYEEEITDGNLSVYAGEDLNKYKVRPANITNGNEIVVSEFSHWALLSDPTTEFDLTKPITSSVDLIAVYTTHIQYGVYYWSHDGSTQIYGENIAEGETISGVYKGAPLDKTPAAPSTVTNEDGSITMYEFSHWAYKENTTVKFDATTPITDRVDLIAVYEEKTGYTVTYYHRTGSTMYQETVILGKLATGFPGTLTSETDYVYNKYNYQIATGVYTFSHWAYKDDPTKEFVFETDIITENTELIAIYNVEYKRFNIPYYKYDGSSQMFGQSVAPGSTLGAYNGAPVDNSSYMPASYTDTTDNAKVTYVFSHWGDLENPEVEFDFTQPITKPLSLIAVYNEIRTYGVYYWNHDGSTQIYGESVVKGNTIGIYKGTDLTTQPAAPEAPDDGSQYSFSHWINKDTGEKFDITTPIVSETNLQAVYIKGYTVSYYNDDNTLIGTEGVETGKAATMSVTAPDKEYHTFLEWVYEDGTKADLSNITENVNVYASYKLNDNVILVTVYGVDYMYNLGYETVLETHYIEIGNGITLNYDMSFPTKEVNGVRTNYTFIGWGDKEGNLIDITNITESIDLYPIFEENYEYAINLYNRTNELIQKDWVAENNTYVCTVIPETIKKATTDYQTLNVYTFEKWIDENGDEFDFSTPIMESIDLYASYTMEELSVTSSTLNRIDDIEFFYGSSSTSNFKQLYIGHTFSKDYCYIRFEIYNDYVYADGTMKTQFVKQIHTNKGACILENTGKALTAGTVTINASYDCEGTLIEVSKDIVVKVVPASTITEAIGISITRYPVKMEYLVGEEVDLTGLEVSVDGTASYYFPVNETYSSYATKYGYTGIIPLHTGQYTVEPSDENPYLYTITYKTKDAEFYLPLEFKTTGIAKISTLEVASPGYRDNYYDGSYFNDVNTIYNLVINKCDLNGNIILTDTYTGTSKELEKLGTFIYNENQPLKIGQTQVPITFKLLESEESFTTFANVTVNEKTGGLADEGTIFYWDYTLDENGKLTYTYNGIEKGISSASEYKFPIDVKEIYIDLNTYTGEVPEGALYQLYKEIADLHEVSLDNLDAALINFHYEYFPLKYLTYNLSTVETIEINSDQDITANFAGMFYNDVNLKTISFTGNGVITAGQDNAGNGYIQSALALAFRWSSDIESGLSFTFYNCYELDTINWGNFNVEFGFTRVMGTFHNVGVNNSLDETNLIIDLASTGIATLSCANLNSDPANYDIFYSEYIISNEMFELYENIHNCSHIFYAFYNTTANTIKLAPNDMSRNQVDEHIGTYIDCNINTLIYDNVRLYNNAYINSVINDITICNSLINSYGTHYNNPSSYQVFENVSIQNLIIESSIIDCLLKFNICNIGNINIKETNILGDMSLINTGFVSSGLKFDSCILGNITMEDIGVKEYEDETVFCLSIINSTLNELIMNNIVAEGYDFSNLFKESIIQNIDIQNFKGYENTVICLDEAFYNATLNDDFDLHLFDGMYIYGDYGYGLRYTFANSYLNGITELDLSGWVMNPRLNNAPHSMEGMFSDSIFTKIIMPEFNTSAIENYSKMFYNSKVEELVMPFTTISMNTDTTDMFTGVKNLKKVTTPLEINKSINLPNFTNNFENGYYWYEEAVNTKEEKFVYMPENTTIYYGWLTHYVVDGKDYSYNWTPVDGTHIVLPLPETTPETKSWNFGLQEGDLITNYSDSKYYILNGTEKIRDNFWELRLSNLKDYYTVTYYDEDKTTILFEEIYNYDEVAEDKVVFKSPYVDGNEYVITVDNYWNFMETDERVTVGTWEHINYNVELYAEYEEKRISLTDAQYIISGTLNENNPAAYEDIRIIVTNKIDNNEILNILFTDSYSITGLIADTDYIISYIDESTQTELLKLEITSDLQNLGINTIGGLDSFSYKYKRSNEEYSFILDVGTFPKVQYNGNIAYNDGTPLSNETITLSVNGFKPDGSYEEAKATNTIWTEYIEAMPLDWDRSDSPEDANYYRFTYADMEYLSGLNSYISKSDTGYRIDGGSSLTAIFQNFFATKKEYNGLELGYVIDPMTGKKYTLTFNSTISSYGIPMEHYRIIDGVTLYSGWADYSGDNTIKTIVFDNTSNWTLSDNALKMNYMNKLESVWFSPFITKLPSYTFRSCPQLTNIIFMEPEKSQLKTIDSYLFYGYDTFPNVKKLYLPYVEGAQYRIWAGNGNYNPLPNLEKIYFNAKNLGTHIASGLDCATNIDANFYTRQLSDNITYMNIDSLIGFRWSPTLRFDNLDNLSTLIYLNLNGFTTAGYTRNNGFISGGALEWIYFGNPNLASNNKENLNTLSSHMQNVKDIYFNVSKEVLKSWCVSGSLDTVYPSSTFHTAHNIKYDLNGGYANQTLPSTYIDGWTEDGYIVIPNPYREGYSFAYWEIVEARSATLSQYETYTVLRQDRCYGDVYLKAIWIEETDNSNIYTVTTDENGNYEFEAMFKNEQLSYLTFADSLNKFRASVSVDENDITNEDSLQILSIENDVELNSVINTTSPQLDVVTIDLTLPAPTIVNEELDSIEIVVPPDKVEYLEGETFDPTGMVVDATYKITWSDGNTTYNTVNNVAYDYNNKDALTVSVNNIVVSYTDGVTKSALQPITVNAPTIVSKTLKSINIVTPPDDIDYFVDETFNPTGMIVDATYEVLWSDDSKTYEIVKDVKYDYDLKSELKLTDTVVTVSYTDTGITKTDNQAIIVKEKPIEVIKSVKGNITINGKPLANIKVVLHSDPITTYTDENGNYEFKNVTKEVHTLQVFKDEENVIAEVKVDVTAPDDTNTGVFVIVNTDDNTKVETDKNENDYIVNCNITTEEDPTTEPPSEEPPTTEPSTEPETEPDSEPDSEPETEPDPVPDIPKTGDDTNIVLLISMVLSSFIIILLMVFKFKNNDINEDVE